jgi:hypothetical protein
MRDHPQHLPKLDSEGQAGTLTQLLNPGHWTVACTHTATEHFAGGVAGKNLWRNLFETVVCFVTAWQQAYGANGIPAAAKTIIQPT